MIKTSKNGLPLALKKNGDWEITPVKQIGAWEIYDSFCRFGFETERLR